VNREDIVALAARLFAIYLLVVGAQFVASSISLNFLEAGLVPLYTISAVVVLLLMVSFVLWVFPLSVARKLLPAMRDRAAGETLNSSTVLGLGLTLFGVWLFAHALNDLVYWGTFWIKNRAVGGFLENASPGEYAHMCSAAFRFLLSLFLMLGSNGIRHVLFRLRYGPGTGGL
jgi:hypothetical protein